MKIRNVESQGPGAVAFRDHVKLTALIWPILVTFIVHARFTLYFLNASTGIDAPMQDSKQGTMIVETVFYGPCYC